MWEFSFVMRSIGAMPRREEGRTLLLAPLNSFIFSFLARAFPVKKYILDRRSLDNMANKRHSFEFMSTLHVV